MTLLRAVTPRFARFATNVLVRRPALWRLFRAPLRAQFDRLAPHWDGVVSPGHLAPLGAALDALGTTPRRILDLGTGTGRAVVFLAERYPAADIVGVDLSPAMIERARAAVPEDPTRRARFAVADAQRLPFSDGEFELVTLVNMIPFFDELARVVAPGGHVVFSFSQAEQTPIFVAPERLRGELARRDFHQFAEFRAGNGLGFLAAKRPQP
jgi:SAM-dependent methyltransferase